jgi:pimeloyl-ACP methyl ester carboxylesterase
MAALGMLIWQLRIESSTFRKSKSDRWRIDLAAGEPKYDDLEKRLAQGSAISVPTITLEGDANGAPHAPPAAYRAKFSGKYEHRDLTGGIGHNLPQEAPQAFAQAVADVDSMS